MPNPTRLMIARNEATESVTAIDLDSQTQVFITEPAEHYNFFVDCIGLDQLIADRYDAGQVIACGMSAENWSAWCEHYAIESPDYVWLTCQADAGQRGRVVNAMDLVTHRKVLVIEDKFAFINDISGWNHAAFKRELSFVCQMRRENWMLWLSEWEAITLTDAIA